MPFNRRTFVETLATAGVMTAAPLFAQGKTVEVWMKNQPAAVFHPASIKIGVGDTVLWTNPELITHTVTFDPAQASDPASAALPDGVKPFGSGDMEQDGTFQHTFSVKGVYKYFCKNHEKMGMTGTVAVS